MFITYRNWLIGKNPTSGSSWWWLIFTLGLITILFSIALALPCFALWASWKSFVCHTEFIQNVGYMTTIYEHWTMNERMAGQFMLTLPGLLSILVLGWIMTEVGWNLARGRHYHHPKPYGHWGFWT